MKGMNETKLADLLSGSEYVPTYEDKDGDWMLVGDTTLGVSAAAPRSARCAAWLACCAGCPPCLLAVLGARLACIACLLCWVPALLAVLAELRS